MKCTYLRARTYSGCWRGVCRCRENAAVRPHCRACSLVVDTHQWRLDVFSSKATMNRLNVPVNHLTPHPTILYSAKTVSLVHRISSRNPPLPPPLIHSLIRVCANGLGLSVFGDGSRGGDIDREELFRVSERCLLNPLPCFPFSLVSSNWLYSSGLLLHGYRVSGRNLEFYSESELSGERDKHGRNATSSFLLVLLTFVPLDDTKLVGKIDEVIC